MLRYSTFGPSAFSLPLDRDTSDGRGRYICVGGIGMYTRNHGPVVLKYHGTLLGLARVG